MNNKPAKYWRRNKTWQQWLGQEGVVEAATYIRVAAEKYQLLAPYSFVLVDLNGVKKEFMGCGHQKLQAGDQVQVVLRRAVENSPKDLIDYQLKVKKIG